MVTVVNEGTILPARYPSQVFDWGIGGILDESGEFVEESGMGVWHRFGGRYEYDKNNCTYLDETVIYVGPMRDHWGHFIAECSVRLWYLLENETDCRIAFCGLWFDEGKMSSKVTDVFRLLGVEKDRLLDIRKPTKVKRILIPSPALQYDPYHFAAGKIEDFYLNWSERDYRCNYTAEFRNIFQHMIQKVEAGQYKTAEKVYYTRTGLGGKNEIGENLIEKIFRKNGYMVVSPEKESVEAQIVIMNSCKVFASIEGTPAHNIVFARENIRQIILVKNLGKNTLQEPLDKCMGIEAKYIYIGCRPFGRKFPHGGYDGICWLRPCRALKRWCCENNMWFPGRLEIFGVDLKNLLSYIRLCGREMQELLKSKREMLREKRRILKLVKNYQNIVLYGVSARCLKWKDMIEKRYPQKRLYWMDTNDEAIRRYIQVYGVEEAGSMKDCVYLIGIANSAAVEEVKKKLLHRGIEEEKIYVA